MQFCNHCRELVQRLLIKSTCPAQLPTKYNMKIRLMSDTPYYCAPRRLYYSDRIEVDQLISTIYCKIISLGPVTRHMHQQLC